MHRYPPGEDNDATHNNRCVTHLGYGKELLRDTCDASVQRHDTLRSHPSNGVEKISQDIDFHTQLDEFVLQNGGLIE